ncbi:putative cytosol aminopeptidase [Sulfurimicrobium lacus]|uniref:Probable cytosol aminopeptidase n=1 Tax=Sulfurimicrobium lacus TaxID=2715678 RepID=A0A6F8VBI1_9PROT|nr:leucyl aminopeptidase [Sulfurimicrobium lacus]BCB26366.1 putative cytosol aminopeptidase [Sulfurimicrobium lacus]
MEFSIKSGSPEKQRTACVVVGVFEHRKLSLAADLMDRVSGFYISDILRRGDMDGKLGSTVLLHNVPNALCDRLLLVGLGKEREFKDKEYREAVGAAVKALNATGATEAAMYLTEVPVKKRELSWKVEQAVMVAMESVYRFDRLKSKQDEQRRPLRKMVLSVPRRNELSIGEAALNQGLAIAQGMNLAKDLANLPGNICTPTYIAEQAQELAKTHQLKIEVLEQKDMEALKMGSFLSVAKGSRQPPKLIVLQYAGAAKNQKPVVLVGKGITFDAGGISLKPAAEMDEMKYDMCGAASVLGVFRAIAEMKLPLNVVGIIPTCENLPDGNANKPGDVVTSMSGQTIEILNTDAEGRLILCDALTYAAKFEPAAVVDIATLTGACVIALGHQASGLLANHDPLARELLHAGEYTYDRAWHMPLWDEYQEQLKSNFADIANIGGRAGGAITAACFLSRFTKDYEWAHLDIAGTAWKSGKEKGATGRPVPLLVHFLLNRTTG